MFHNLIYTIVWYKFEALYRFAFYIILSLMNLECSHGTVKTKLMVLLWTRRRQDDHKMKIICFTDGDDHGDDRWGRSCGFQKRRR